MRRKLKKKKKKKERIQRKVSRGKKIKIVELEQLTATNAVLKFLLHTLSDVTHILYQDPHLCAYTVYAII